MDEQHNGLRRDPVEVVPWLRIDTTDILYGMLLVGGALIIYIFMAALLNTMPIWISVITILLTLHLIALLVSLFKKYKRMIFSKFNIDYIIAYLQSKAIVTNKLDEHNIAFKLSDVNWRLQFDNNRLSIGTAWDLGNDVSLTLIEHAANALNAERYMIKCFIVRNDAEDASQYSVVFAIETLCQSKKAFKQIYEFGMFALMDGIELHRKLYRQFAEEASRQRPQIGFTQNGDPSTPTTQNKRRIGFQ